MKEEATQSENPNGNQSGNQSGSSSGSPSTNQNVNSSHAGWLERLGLIGFSALEAPLLAALITGSPLLLIGAHGTAKSLLLTRIASLLFSS
jgi:MoxR-like ATPase